MRNQVCWHDVKGCTYPNCIFTHPSRDERRSRERVDGAQHLKRRNSDGEDSQSQSQSKKFRPGLIESAQYRLTDLTSSLSLHSGQLEGTGGEIVRFRQYCDQHPRCHFVLIKNSLDQVGYIEEERIGESVPFHCSLFSDCKESFQKEVDFETHLCKEHFYETLKEAVVKRSSKSRRFRCPERECEERFEELSEAILHYGVTDHRAVVSLVYSQSRLGVATNLGLKQKEDGVKKELSVVGKSMAEIDKLKAENKVRESENLALREELKEMIHWKEEAQKKEEEHFLEIQNMKTFVEEQNAKLEECRLQVEKQKEDLILRESEMLELTTNSQELRRKLKKKEEKIIALETHLQEEKQFLENKSSELNQCRNEVSDLKEKLLDKDLKKNKFIEQIESIKKKYNNL